MKTISIHDAKTNLSKYINAAKKGEKIYIGGFGKAEVLLIKLPDNVGNNAKRNFSVSKGKITVSEDAFSTSSEHYVSQLLLGK
jgi:antitoxin (DNA-binding transcriptional repressor) of toxin-antitoxin stability system